MDPTITPLVIGNNAHYGATGGGGSHLPDDPYGTGSESSFSSQLEQRLRQDWHIPQSQFEESIITMNNSLVDLLPYQWQTQNDTTQTFLQRNHSCELYLQENLLYWYWYW